MPDVKTVTITVVDGVVRCNPPELKLKPRESVQWVCPAEVLVDFGTNTPFQRGRFRNDDIATVRDEFTDGKRTPTITVTTVTVGTDVGGVDAQH